MAQKGYLTLIIKIMVGKQKKSTYSNTVMRHHLASALASPDAYVNLENDYRWLLPGSSKRYV